MISPTTHELEFAIRAARKGGDVLMRHLREGTTVREKATNDLVSEADLESEEVIRQYLSELCPDHEFLAEESSFDLKEQSRAEHLWIIDPLDGTTNFAHGIPHFAVSIAYYKNGIAECGVVFNPARDELYTAIRGQGVWLNGRSFQVAETSSFSAMLIGVGFYYDRGEMMQSTLATIEALFKKKIRGIRRFGTASLDLCHVARGMYGAFFEYQLSPWDFAAGRLIVEEAGGQVTTAAGRPLPLDVTSVLASNGKIHDEMLKIIDETAKIPL